MPKFPLNHLIIHLKAARLLPGLLLLAGLFSAQAAAESLPRKLTMNALMGDAGSQMARAQNHADMGDFAKARFWYEMAAGFGHAAAQTELGLMYVNGLGVERDYRAAFFFFQSAAAGGDVEAQYQLGNLYLYGNGTARDLKQAFVWLDRAGRQEHIAALNNLGYMYGNGLGVETNLERARRYFEQAADQYDALAMVNLGNIYYSGIGVDKDLARALEYFLQAAERRHPLAMVQAARMYQEGDGAPADFVKAHVWYALAANLPDYAEAPQALTQMQELESLMTPEQYIEAVTLLEAWTRPISSLSGKTLRRAKNLSFIADSPAINIAAPTVFRTAPENPLAASDAEPAGRYGRHTQAERKRVLI